ncbi:MAG TPA: GGDEF domain-containing protein [Candidatus Nanopelagicaceae bacterium]|nr:GGDEF domain-containing protein [Candidatus Nanopelagicaceae bacterium]
MNPTAPPAAPLRPGQRRDPRAAYREEGTTWAREFFVHPNRMTTVFWGGGAVAALVVLPLGHWSAANELVLVAVGGFSGIAGGVRAILGERVPRGLLHVDMALATVLVSTLAAVGVSGAIQFADLYIWVGIFAVLYFGGRSALIHIAAAGAAYAVVLAIGPKDPNPVGDWCVVFGTLAVTAWVTYMLVGFLRSSARVDPLTGLPNRRSFDERLAEEVDRSRREHTALSVVMSDVDHFKTLNDSRGHAAGDQTLRALASSWRRAVRGGGDVVARIGGDEFAMISPGAGASGVRGLIQRLREALPEGVSVSFGAASWDGAESGVDLLRRADEVMYQAKLGKRGSPGNSDRA